MIFASPLPDVEIPDMPVTTYVLSHSTDMSGETAIIDGPTGRTLTYAELEDGIRALAGGLVARGFAKGEVIALMSPNNPEFAVIFHGIAMAGGTITTINPSYTYQETQHQLVDSNATMLITVPLFLDVARKSIEGTNVREIFVIGEAEGATSLSELFGPPLAEHVPVEPSDVVVLPYSSGTTGLSKGVMLTHRNLIANIAQVVSAGEITSADRLIAVLPFFHIYGMQVLMNTGLKAGATIITMPRFDLAQFLQLHQDYAITRSFVAPPIVVALAKHPLVDDYDLSSLSQVFSGAAPLSAELALAAGARIGCNVVQGYGMTELSPVSQLTPPNNFKAGSTGITAPNTFSRIVDPITGKDLGVNEDGELCIKGPQVMTGYLNNPAATAATIDPDGWLHTGDIGHFDEDGHLFIVDRLKELIKYKGFQVAPAELEALLLTHPAVADAAVIGRPDEEAGEIPIAFVVLRPGSEATESDIKAFVAERAATYKHIHHITFTDAIPKSASGKILRRILKEPS